VVNGGAAKTACQWSSPGGVMHKERRNLSAAAHEKANESMRGAFH
jgi:hypothetical protein